MLIKYAEWLSNKNKLNKLYIGTVVFNNDPKKEQRIKVTIPGSLEGSPQDLPWIYSESSSFLGGSINAQLLAVPEVGSEVRVEFPYDDTFYFGKYSYRIDNTKNRPTGLDSNYPNAYGFIDELSNYFQVDKVAGTMTLGHSSGSNIIFNNDGTITFNAPEIDFNAFIKALLGLTVAEGDSGAFTAGNKVVTVKSGIITGGVSS
jgi:hypothetical protein